MRHKQAQLFASIAVAASWLSAPSMAWAQDGLADVRAIKPVLMLVIDTSGSMERMPGSETLPDCTGTVAGDAALKNRWTGALEALTGSFTDFACQSQQRNQTPYNTTDYDFGYYLPHIARLPTVQQTSDGVLDALQYDVKFGLMTFDGQGTYQDGEPLIGFSTITNGPLNDVIGNAPVTGGGAYVGGEAGMFSYGNLKRLSFPGCQEPYGINLGARGPGTHPGAMVSVGGSDDPLTVRANNDHVQSSLLAVRPYGGTPIAAVLDDLRYWLKNSVDVLPPGPENGTDVFANCRDKYAVLLTDGAPDTMYRDTRYVCEPPATQIDHEKGLDRNGDTLVVGTEELCAGEVCSCPYELEVDIASDLVTADVGLDKLFVVAFNVSDAAAITALDAIALAGNTDDAKQVTTANQLRNELNEIFLSSTPEGTSRTVPVSVDGTVGAYTPGAKSFEIRAGFRPNQVPEDPWDGILERTSIGCVDSEVNYSTTLETADKFHDQLDAQSLNGLREVFTLAATATTMRGSLRSEWSVDLDSTSYTGSTVPAKGPDGLSLAATTILPDTTTATNQATYQSDVAVVPFDNTLSPTMFGNADKDATPFEVEDVEYIADFLDGSSRPGHTLSDIYHSNPVALGPLVTAGVGARLGSWRQRLLQDSYASQGGTRPMVVFAATNDGLLHAFNLDTWNGKAPGFEFWSFAPPALFDKLHTAAAPTHIFMFDGDMVVRDMYIGPGTNATLETRTVLLAALRGAPGYVALDVTNPESNPKLLWQFSDASLGDTVGKPQLVQVAIEWTTGQVQERAMAILPGGRGEEIESGGAGCARNLSKARAPADRRLKGRCWKNRGRVLFLVDVATGQVVQKFDQRHFTAPITGSIGIEQNRPLAQSAYFTDDDGVMWHLALDGSRPDQWHVEPLWDLYHGKGPVDGRPASYEPLITRDKTGSNIILLGTGDIDNLTDESQHRVVSLREERTLGTGDFVTTQIKSVEGVDDRQNWEIVLQPHESVTGPLTLLNGTVYFSTFVAASAAADVCELGKSYLWGVHYVEEDLASSPLSLPKGQLVVTEGPPPVLALKEEAADNAVILGLSAGQDPLCLTGSTQYNPVANTSGFVATGGPAASSFHIRANMGSRTSGGTPSGDSGLKLYNKEMKASFKSQVVGWAGSIE